MVRAVLTKDPIESVIQWSSAVARSSRTAPETANSCAELAASTSMEYKRPKARQANFQSATANIKGVEQRTEIDGIRGANLHTQPAAHFPSLTPLSQLPERLSRPS